MGSGWLLEGVRVPGLEAVFRQVGLEVGSSHMAPITLLQAL